MMDDPIPEWRLPPGVTRALWEYSREPRIAWDYDQYLSGSALVQFDEAVVLREYQKPGRLIDLGCGTGRLAIPFAARGFEVLGVDLSWEMLQVVKQKAREHAVPVRLLQANLCELDCAPDSTFDYALLMFSTLGMISGAENRRRALAHVYRTLKPGGQFALHVHNLWFNLFDPHGRRWLLRDRVDKFLKRHPGGDKTLADRGIPHMYMHVFSRPEILGQLQSVGLQVEQIIPLSATGAGPLFAPAVLGGIRANGWIFLTRRD